MWQGLSLCTEGTQNPSHCHPQKVQTPDISWSSTTNVRLILVSGCESGAWSGICLSLRTKLCWLRTAITPLRLFSSRPSTSPCLRIDTTRWWCSAASIKGMFKYLLIFGVSPRSITLQFICCFKFLVMVISILSCLRVVLRVGMSWLSCQS